jgi:hypothetical protein
VFQVFSGAFGKKNVTGITAIHHSLGHFDPGAGDVGLFIQVANFVHRPL